MWRYSAFILLIGKYGNNKTDHSYTTSLDEKNKVNDLSKGMWQNGFQRIMCYIWDDARQSCDQRCVQVGKVGNVTEGATEGINRATGGVNQASGMGDGNPIGGVGGGNRIGALGSAGEAAGGLMG